LASHFLGDFFRRLPIREWVAKRMGFFHRPWEVTSAFDVGQLNYALLRSFVSGIH
jgi:hypothetical protein